MALCWHLFVAGAPLCNRVCNKRADTYLTGRIAYILCLPDSELAAVPA